MRGERQNQNQTRNNDLPRSRALGIIILMFALLLFQVGVFLFDKVFRGERQEAGPSAAPSTATGAKPALFQFDPNTICPDSLCLLGFSRKQAESIVKYRDKGGKFRKKSDFAKMYVVSEEKYAELEPYIFVSEHKTPAPPSAQRRDSAQPRNSARQQASAQPRNSARQQASAQPRKSAQQRKSAQRPASADRLAHRIMADSLRVPLMVDINAADSASLTRLYGIGGYYARKIIEYRERLGNFYSVAQLMEIPGIDSVRFGGFARNITADPGSVRCFSLDTAGKYFLMRHPYVGAYAARGILLMREKFGAGACTMENLVKERILSPQMAEKLWHYISDSSF